MEILKRETSGKIAANNYTKPVFRAYIYRSKLDGGKVSYLRQNPNREKARKLGPLRLFPLQIIMNKTADNPPVFSPEIWKNGSDDVIIRTKLV
jgi:hypothetical protein